MSNKHLILSMMNEVLSLRSLLPEELRSYCSLLQGKRPSSLLLVSKHMIQLIQEDKVNRDTLRRSGLIPILVDYLVTPTEYSCEQVLKTDVEELKLALLLLDSKNSIQYEQDIEKRIHEVLYGIAKTMLQLIIIVLRNNLENQVTFRER
jgi:hypothetical protein